MCTVYTCTCTCTCIVHVHVHMLSYECFPEGDSILSATLTLGLTHVHIHVSIPKCTVVCTGDYASRAVPQCGLS